MLCHLEEFCVAYYQLMEVIDKALEYINQDYSIMEPHEIMRLEEILKGE